MNYLAYYKSPTGLLEIAANETKITQVQFVTRKKKESGSRPAHMKACLKQLDEYFKGKRETFDLPLELEGTDFQVKVWKQLLKIPHGKTLSYGELAKKIGNPDAPRAVGGANNKNKITVIIPCHRVIGASGKLVGYGGGLGRKEWLLSHEGIALA